MADAFEEDSDEEQDALLEVLMPMQQILQWIGFIDPDERETLSVDFVNFEAFGKLKEKEITDLQKDYSGRKVDEGQIRFGVYKTNLLKNTIHWIQDFVRCGETPSIEGLDEDTFLMQLAVAGDREEIRQKVHKNVDQVTKDAGPGSLESEKKWIEWEEKIVTMLGMIPGANGVPLSYVIRAVAEPDRTALTGMSFVQKTIACSPLRGTTFEADSRSVHQIILKYVQGTDAYQWIKPDLKLEDGRRDMIALRNHYHGEGNVSRRISEAERIRNNLFYKGERILPFATYLNKCQSMFNIYANEGEPYSDDQKIRFLLDHINSADLLMGVAAVRVQLTFDDQKRMTFTSISNHLATEVSKSPEAVARSMRNIASVSGVGAEDADQEPAEGGKEPEGNSIYLSNGQIFTGNYVNWFQLSRADKDKVIAERKAKSGAHQNNKDKKVKSKKNNLDRRVAAALKRLVAASSTNPEDSEDGADGKASSNAAGDAFGGRAEKKDAKRARFA